MPLALSALQPFVAFLVSSYPVSPNLPIANQLWSYLIDYARGHPFTIKQTTSVPRPDHAIAMSYFANDCLRKMTILVKKLEVSLGPDTADLSMRIGLHR